jgi:hypothetical protein
LTPISEIPHKEIQLASNNKINLSSNQNIKQFSKIKKFELNICSKLCPAKICESISSESKKIIQIDAFLKKWMSYQNLLNYLFEFERFKFIKLNSEQLQIFNRLKIYNFEKLSNHDRNLKLADEEYEKVIKKIDEDFIKRLNEFNDI